MTTKYEEDAKKVLLHIDRICMNKGLAKAEFYRIYYRECVHPSAQNDEVERFVDRIEKIKPNQRGCIDRLGPMLDFAQRKYCGGVLMIDEQSKQAAWEYFVEINTRVINARCPIEVGCPKSALSSLHTFFERVRALAVENYQAADFFWFVEPFYNGVFREFYNQVA